MFNRLINRRQLFGPLAILAAGAAAAPRAVASMENPDAALAADIAELTALLPQWSADHDHPRAMEIAYRLHDAEPATLAGALALMEASDLVGDRFRGLWRAGFPSPERIIMRALPALRAAAAA